MDSRLTIPRATYRLQFQSGFTLRHARELVPYLEALGISHIYASPLLKACPGSTHGYDVCDPSQLNPEIGTEAELESFVTSLRRRGMGLVLDIVPNHLGIAGGANPWWQDVLRYGRASTYARHFDIDWNSPDPELRHKVLVPVLGDEYEHVLARGELQLVLERDTVTLCYFEHRFPLTPGSLPSLGSPAETGLRDLNDNPAALDAVILRQHYRLVHWRRGDAELNYRRFFNISALAGVRVEAESVFNEVHARVRDWLERCWLDGLRVDHPDGLRDPAQYLQRLRQLATKAWIVAEKILEPGETLPADWPVAGTTGYDFLNLVNGLFVDPSGERPLTEFYADFTGEPTDYPAILLDQKRLVLRELFAAEVNQLARLLPEIAARQPSPSSLTEDAFREAVIELAAAFPVYRTYIRADAQTVHELDLGRIRAALTSARAQRTDLGNALDFLSDLLTLERRGDLESEFVMRFQQLTGPAMAKGAEDTAFYRFNRLVSLNEVGGDPGRFGVSVEEFHRSCEEQQRRWPHTMLASSTHDTKRSEDVRARINLLSEMPGTWAAAVRRWSAMNEKHRRNGLPDRNAEHRFYQMLVGTWPLSVERALAYLDKAACEAKQHTRWTQRNPAYDQAAREYVAATMQDAEFMKDLEAFVAPLRELGFINSLAQTLIKLTAPGVPDIYQGTELWDFSLVDPDNRRPVDFATRRRVLTELESLSAEQVWLRRDSGLPKLWLIWRTLALRRRQPQPFEAEYKPLAARGAKATHVVAFSRGDEIVTVAPRLVIGLAGDWSDTTLELPRGEWRNALSGKTAGNGACRLADLLRTFPVALLARKDLA